MVIGSGAIANAEKKKAADDRAHLFLAIVQEEPRTPIPWNLDPTHFVVYILDSAPNRFRCAEVQKLFHNTVRNVNPYVPGRNA